MRGEIGTPKFNWEQTAFRHMIKRDPGDMMLDGVWMRNLFADRDFDIEWNAWRDSRRSGDYRRVLFSLPVGGFDICGYAHNLVGVRSWSWESGVRLS